jgi:hypothetical protein
MPQNLEEMLCICEFKFCRELNKDRICVFVFVFFSLWDINDCDWIIWVNFQFVPSSKYINLSPLRVFYGELIFNYAAIKHSSHLISDHHFISFWTVKWGGPLLLCYVRLWSLSLSLLYWHNRRSLPRPRPSPNLRTCAIKHFMWTQSSQGRLWCIFYYYYYTSQLTIF